jgi:hypothetical protein
MSSAAEKHAGGIDESVNRLVSRAANSRGIAPDELKPRVSSALEKYLLKDDSEC